VPKYDLAVVGAGLGGLAATALLSRKNKKAIVIEPGNAVGGALRTFEKGVCLHHRPAPSFGFERGGAIQDLCESLGVPATLPCFHLLSGGTSIEGLRSTPSRARRWKNSEGISNEIDATADSIEISKKVDQNIKPFLLICRTQICRGFIRRYSFIVNSLRSLMFNHGIS
jgi:phytoene dehydrogenase-like protein